MRIYVASNSTTKIHQDVILALRNCGHRVYDFMKPAIGKSAFRWDSLGEDRWQEWTPAEFRKSLSHPLAAEAFELDQAAMKQADLCVLVAPFCSWGQGMLEAGWCAGAGKPLYILLSEQHPTPEIAFRMATRIFISIPDMIQTLGAGAVLIAEACRRLSVIFATPSKEQYDDQVLMGNDIRAIANKAEAEVAKSAGDLGGYKDIAREILIEACRHGEKLARGEKTSWGILPSRLLEMGKKFDALIAEAPPESVEAKS